MEKILKRVENMDKKNKRRQTTKLQEWVSVISPILALWYSLVGGYMNHPFIKNNMTWILFSPIVFVVLFGLYMVTVILYRVFTFNNCNEAAKELQEEIDKARADLHEKGLR